MWSLRALFTIEGGRSCEVHLEWKDDAELAAWTEYVQPQGEPRTTYDALGWAAAVESYRPVLSYNELGGMLEEKPSAFFDALSRILGLDALTDAARRLQQARSGREGLTRRGDTLRDPIPARYHLDSFRGKAMNEIVFLVEEAPEGGYTANALGASIVTEADSLPELRSMVQDAVRCHFDEGTAPKVIRLHYVREEVLAS